MRSRGQALVLMCTLLPVFVLLAAVLTRTGLLLIGHHRLQAHCQKKVLDALAVQARGLEELGRLNPVARRVIDLRRTLEALRDVEILAPPVAEALETTILELKSAQRTINTEQKTLTKKAQIESALLLRAQPDKLDQGRSIESFGPSNPLLSHGRRNALVLHVTPSNGYENETGPPYQLDQDFPSRQLAWGEIRMQAEKYVDHWKQFTALPDISVQCRAQVQMDSLEAPWKVQLTAAEAKPSLKRPFQQPQY